MLTWILAHGSGIDELFIFGWPVIVGIGFWFIVRRKPEEDQPDDTPPQQPNP
jgi:hypothetical protein